MFGLGIPEIAIIIVVLGLLFFGAGKISDFAKGLGRFTGEFRKGKMEMEKEIKDIASLTEEERKKPAK